MKYENSMVKIADDIIRDQQTERKVQNQKQKWHDEYATLKFFRYICRNVGNLQEGEAEGSVRTGAEDTDASRPMPERENLPQEQPAQTWLRDSPRLKRGHSDGRYPPVR